MGRQIFVFGSNLAGRHGKGSALAAMRDHGAIYGVGEGIQGNAYAIPTKDARLRSLPLDDIKVMVRIFMLYARLHPDDTFNVVKIGCGLAGYLEDEIAPLFKGAPDNCILPKGWRQGTPDDTSWQPGVAADMPPQWCLECDNPLSCCVCFPPPPGLP